MKYKFDNAVTTECYILARSAYLKESKGDLKGAIKDLSLAIKNKNRDRSRDYYLFVKRGKLFFKVKKYKEAINDFSDFFIQNKEGIFKQAYRENIESIFLKECCEILLKKANLISDTKRYLSYMLLIDTQRSKSYINFLIALKYSKQNLFEKSLDKLLEIRDLDSTFFEKRYYYYLLVHLPKKMRPFLNLCWELI